ncbi:hypothetical protein AJ80_00032 [Polytolypa hystricis UAMH7299]|uniref:alpha-1,2-Mannosidase n=1 Tax=Polytolypa hystricis (strain UAMH7299) TaxID=1447883 RepID=A0A2B7Z530_POLH7|nr:hypothetical protein AJ80_00032 [Polytolypa hystricis UAMH7299]
MRGSALSAGLIALLLVPLAVAHPVFTDQSSGGVLKRQNDERAAAVKSAFEFAFNGYLEYAFPDDDLRPVSNTSGNSRNGWGASAVDALSTAAIMGSSQIVDKVLEHIATIDYSKTNSGVNLFETTIRYLGGMLSAYDLLNGPRSDIPSNKDHVKALLEQSKKLADVMKFAFDTPTGIPSNNLDIASQKRTGGNTNGIATTGTLIIEWTRLSDLTGDSQYTDLVQKAEAHLLDPKPKSSEPFPGLIGTRIDINTGLFQDDSVSWGAGDDSFYEYLIKMYIYDPKTFEKYKDRWVLAVESSIKHLKSSPGSRPDLTFLATYKGGKLGLSSQHLTCFDGGNFILGGQVLGREDIVNFGLQLVEGCHATYAQTVTKLGPESFSWDEANMADHNREFYEKSGFYITNSAYHLRPEVVESYYYAYRATGDSKYQDWAWDAFVALNETTRTGSGFTAIRDVNAPGGGGSSDYQESFLFAEVMKYSYMIHVPDGEWQVSRDGNNKWVYNTEAHPVKIRG